MINKIVVIGDIHFGIKETERIYTELKQFIDFIKNNDIDIIQLNGDYFDRTLNFAEPAGLYALQFWSQLLDVCREKNIKLRSIEGTLSHDNFQTEALLEFINYDDNGKPDVDFKYIKTVEVEDLNGMHILYCPEEYPMDADEYYDKFKKDKYDLMFVHGMWDFTGLSAVADHGRKDINSAPWFIYNEWKDALEHGLCISGHYHGQMINKDEKVIYPGSFSAWNFDYDNNRGFCYIEFNTETKEYKYQLIQNEFAPKFVSLKVHDLPLGDPYNSPVEDLKLAIDAEIANADRFKLDLTGLNPNVAMILKRAYRNTKFVTMVDNNVKLINEAKNTSDTNDTNNVYSFVLENALPMTQIIKRFIEIKFNKTITEEEIEACLNEEIDINKAIGDIDGK